MRQYFSDLKVEGCFISKNSKAQNIKKNDGLIILENFCCMNNTTKEAEQREGNIAMTKTNKNLTSRI